MRGLLVQARDLDADPGQAAGERPAHRRLHARGVGARRQADDRLVDRARAAGEPLRRLQRRERHAEAGLGAPDRALAGDDEPLRRHRVADVAQPPVADAHGARRPAARGGRRSRARGRRPRGRRRRGAAFRPRRRRERVDRAAARARPSRRCGPARRRVRRGADASSWAGRLRRSCASATPGTDAAVARSRPAGAKLPSARLTRRSWARSAAKLASAEATRHCFIAPRLAYRPGPDRQHERHREHDGPARTQVTPRPADPEAEPHAPTSAARRCRRARPPAVRRRRCARSRAR